MIEMTGLHRPDGALKGTGQTIYVQQGDWALSADPAAMIATTLGSCVSVCLWDPRVGVGGLNHIVLPMDISESPSAAYTGVHAMELLINGLLKSGACKTTMEAKVFGGARILSATSTVGERNTAFAKEFLEREGIPIVGGSVGGNLAREIRFWPTSGRAMQRFRQGENIKETIAQPVPPAAGEIELF